MNLYAAAFWTMCAMLAGAFLSYANVRHFRNRTWITWTAVALGGPVVWAITVGAVLLAFRRETRHPEPLPGGRRSFGMMWGSAPCTKRPTGPAPRPWDARAHGVLQHILAAHLLESGEAHLSPTFELEVRALVLERKELFGFAKMKATVQKHAEAPRDR